MTDTRPTLDLDLVWQAGPQPRKSVEPELFALLDAIKHTGKLTEATQQVGIALSASLGSHHCLVRAHGQTARHQGKGTGHTAYRASRTAALGPRPFGGRVEMWRGLCRSDISVSAPFVWRCLSSSPVAPFPHPAHRTGHVDLPGRRGCCHPRPPQTRTCTIRASGSSRESFVPSGVTVSDPRQWQRMAVEKRAEVFPWERLPARPTFQPFVPYPHDLVAILS